MFLLASKKTKMLAIDNNAAVKITTLYPKVPTAPPSNAPIIPDRLKSELNTPATVECSSLCSIKSFKEPR